MTIKLAILNPSSEIEILYNRGERLETLRGKTIGFLTNNEWQAHRTLPVIRDWILENFSDVKVLPINCFPSGNSNIATQETIALVVEAKVDAIIMGNAA